MPLMRHDARVLDKERRSLLGLGVILAILLLAGETWALLSHGPRGAEIATVLGLQVAAVATVAALIQIRLERSRGEAELTRALRNLASSVRTDRQRFLDLALGVTWDASPARVPFARPDRSALPPSAVELLTRWQAVDGQRVGTIGDMADHYAATPSGRLTVLGDPGSGKTFAISRLCVDLIAIATATPDDPGPPVPVWLSLPSCDLGDHSASTPGRLSARLDRWIARRLTVDHGVPPGLARQLVRDRRVVPVLDGLDEMDPQPVDPANSGVPALHRPKAQALLRALNHDRRRPVVIACRHLDYIATAREATGAPVPVVMSSDHVILKPIPPKDVAAYLAERFPGVTPWTPVIDELRLETPGVTELLGNPWHLFLAITTHAVNSPTELLERDVASSVRAMHRELISVVAQKQLSQGGSAARFAMRAESYLRSLAHHQHAMAVEDGLSETDVDVPGLWRMQGSNWPNFVPPLAAGIPALAAALWLLSSDDLTTWIAGMTTVPLAVAFTVLAGSVMVEGQNSAGLPLLDLSALRSATTLRRVRSSLLLGPLTHLVLARWGAPRMPAELAVTALATTCALEIVATTLALLSSAVNLTTAALLLLCAWSGIGLTIAIRFELVREIDTVSRVSGLAPRSLAYAVVVGIGMSSLVGVVVWLLVGQSAASELGLVLTVMVATTVGMISLLASGGAIWVRYCVAMVGAARPGTAPFRMASFLDWCLAAGFLRMAGTRVQFRHRELQRCLLADKSADS
jgi:hypothetical protein